MKKVIAIIGPTAVGKTKVSLELASRFNGEIINGDSMQIYRGLDIGTAKIKKEEMKGIPHHLFDIKNPDESFSVYEFQRLVRGKIEEISSRDHLPFIVGGTGLYIQAVLYDYQFQETAKNLSVRKQLEEKAKTEGIHSLFQQLQEIDPEYAEKIHPNNERRVIRALEVYLTTGKPISTIVKEQRQEMVYDGIIIGLTMEREKLYQRINDRVDQMFAEGLLEEARTLYKKRLIHSQAAQAIGYKELFPYFDGTLTLEEAKNLLKQNTRRFAKRQLTWFRNKMDVTWFDMTDEEQFEKKIEEISHFLAGKLDSLSNT